MKRLIVLLGVAGVSLSAVFVRWSTAPSLILALYRMAFSAALMAVPVLAGRRRELKSLTRRDVLLCLASGLFLGIHFAAYFGALRATSIASAVVLVDTEVFFVAAASALFLGQRLPRRTWPAVLLAFAGSAVVALADSAAGTNALLGDLIALAGAAAMAVYTMIGTVCRQRLSTSVYTLYYRVVVIRAPLQGLCYTVRDAVDWLGSPTTRWFQKGSNHSPLQFC